MAEQTAEYYLGGSMALSLFALSNSFDVRITQSFAIGVAFFFLAYSTGSPEKAERPVAHFLHLSAPPLEFNLDCRGVAFTKESNDGSVKHAGGRGKRDIIAQPEGRCSAFVHLEYLSRLVGS
jgi:hypothetical protein